jgi:hypothetical protein
MAYSHKARERDYISLITNQDEGFRTFTVGPEARRYKAWLHAILPLAS